MNKAIFKLNKNGVKELLKSPAMRNVITEYAAQIAQRAGDGYDFEVRAYPERLHGNVFPATEEAAHDNYENNTLLKAL